MANIKSQIKRIRTNEKARLRNKAAKAEVKTRIKTAIVSAETAADDAGEHLRMAVKRLDKAAARGIIHANQASNRKSALMRHAAHLAQRHSADLAGVEAGGASGTGGADEASGTAATTAAARTSRPRRTRPGK